MLTSTVRGLRARVTFIIVLAVFALTTVVLAGGLTALLPEHALAVLVGWGLAAWAGGVWLRRRYLGPA
jgi:hypothetical protein